MRDERQRANGGIAQAVGVSRAGGAPTGQGSLGDPGSPSAPVPSLPKGGGAIRGIGEKFSTTAATGTGSLGIPIATSPGRAGFQLGLALTYDSGAGNGPFGLGWRLGIPAITRKTDKGLPRYLDEEESDVFVLSGAEDLVPVPFVAADGSETQEHPRTSGGVEYRVRRYRPRVEGLFARIERWIRSDGDVHWRSLSRDNVLHIYGRTENARVVERVGGARPLRVLSWLLEETRDDRGNVVHYLFAPEDERGVDRARASESNRFAPGDAGAPVFLANAQTYPKRVRYGNCEPLLDREAPVPAGGEDWLFEVVFDYGDHDAVNPVPEPDRPWPVRGDPFSSHRAGFEVRTYRLCRRVLVFHRFAELGDEACLVRSTDFTHVEAPVASYLTAVTQAYYERGAGGAYTRATMPPLELSYVERKVHDAIEALDPESLDGIARGVDGSVAQWLDLDGEGLPGVLIRAQNAFYFKENLGEGRFTSPGREKSMPVPGELRGTASQIADLGGDGNLDLVRNGAPLAGYFERTEERSWAPFVAFPAVPNIDWANPNMRLFDVDGDGRPDVVITEHDTIVWYRSRGKEGFEGPRFARKPRDETEGPAVVFADGTETIQLADMSGDGLVDIVRVRNGEVCYWPNLGHGVFGRKVTLDDSPRFDTTDHFDASRVRLADVDGSGTADIVYLGRDGARLYFNESGNRLGEPTLITSLPAPDRQTVTTVVDLLGRGTACLVSSSPLPGARSRSIVYVDLMGGKKPHLLERIVNNLGAETRITYAPSTKFSLKDKAEARPWVTRLPFPVHVVERIEHEDLVSGSKLVTSFAYHHGHFDGIERDFAGFARVEQWDAETLEGGNRPEHRPPVRTVTWFHTGAHLERERLEAALAREYYGGAWRGGQPPARDYFGRDTSEQDPRSVELVLPDTVFEGSDTPAGNPGPLGIDDEREAARALRGRMLRQEIYAEDEGPAASHPYSVSERSHAVRCVRAATGRGHGVYFSYPRETLTVHYERGRADAATGKWQNDDPRVEHELLLEVDSVGNTIRSVKIGYGRRAVEPTKREQSRLWAALSEHRFANREHTAVDWYRVGVPVESTTSELSALPVPAGLVFSFEELATAISGGAERRIVESRRQVYYRDYPTAGEHWTDAAGSLPLGEITERAIPHETYRRALSKDLVEQVYGADLDVAILRDEGRYLVLDPAGSPATWWSRSGRVVPDPARFFLPAGMVDARDTPAEPIRSLVEHDTYSLLVIEAKDALGNRTTVGRRAPGPTGEITCNGNDYRTLAPRLVCDPNGNVSRAAFDTLGRVSKLWQMGRNPSDEPGDDEANPGVEIRYDVHAWRDQKPVFSHVAVREEHRAGGAAFDASGAPTRAGFQHSRTYSDGFGREVMTKVQAEPGPTPRLTPAGDVVRRADGSPEEDHTQDRWVGTGRTVFDNKGNPVKKYEPFFSRTLDFEVAAGLVESGVATVSTYDPLGRLVRTDSPNGTFSLVVLRAWESEAWDESDTALESAWFDRWSRAPATPAGLIAFLDLFAPPWTTSPTKLERAAWLCMVLGLPPPTAAEVAWLDAPAGATPAVWSSVISRASDSKRATVLAGDHARTPSIAHLDGLGRAFLTVADRGHAVSPAERFQPTRVELDLQGNELAVEDARRNRTLERTFDGLRRPIRTASRDAGESRALFDVADKQVRAWDGRGLEVRQRHDALRRPTDTFVRTATEQTERLVTRVLYGEGLPRDEELGLRARVFRTYDGAGQLTHERYDLKGNPAVVSRRLARDFRSAPDWPIDEGTASALLEDEAFETLTRFDAMSRVTSRGMPRGSETRPAYSQAGLLRSVSASVRGAAPVPFVTNVEHDARGQRTRVSLGNGAETTYTYDPETFRLVRQVTTSAGTTLQDLTYTHDPAGNIVAIRDAVSFANAAVAADGLYRYDAVHQLVQAEGREHPGQQPSEAPPKIHPNDAQGLRRYRETYDYDPVGNLLSIVHRPLDVHAADGWTRRYDYATGSNRLLATSVPEDPPGTLSARYEHDAAGNMTKMPHLARLDWDHANRLIHARRQNGGGPNDVYFAHDASGQRVRKVYEHTGTIEERIYLDGWELYRSRSAGSPEVQHERETLHVMAEQKRVALVETETINTDVPLFVPSTRQRYQLDNHLGSMVLELDAQASVIAYEEYHPFGTRAFAARASSLDVSPRQYAYMGKERDDETGFYYYGARHYAPWLGRWTSPDPLLLVDSPCPYTFVANNPVRFRDPTGHAKTTAIPEQQLLLDELGARIRELETSIQEHSFGTGTDAGNIRDVGIKEYIRAADPHAHFDDVDLPDKARTNTDVRFGDARLKVEFKGETFNESSAQVRNALKDAQRNKYTYAVITKDGQSHVLHTGEAPTAKGTEKLRATAESIRAQPAKTAGELFERTRGARGAPPQGPSRGAPDVAGVGSRTQKAAELGSRAAKALGKTLGVIGAVALTLTVASKAEAAMNEARAGNLGAAADTITDAHPVLADVKAAGRALVGGDYGTVAYITASNLPVVGTAIGLYELGAVGLDLAREWLGR